MESKDRIIFVGVHNKVGKTPLDSTTVSGKRIDKIIECISKHMDVNFIKSNLYEVEYQPVDLEAKVCIAKWITKYEPFDNPIVVLLGNQVQYSFPKLSDIKRIIRLAHPSLQYSKIKEPEYVADACNKILQKLLTTTQKNHKEINHERSTRNTNLFRKHFLLT